MRPFLPGSAIAAVLLALAGCGNTGARTAEDLYTAKAFVTGNDERFRADAFARSLPDALVKVSGDPTLIDDPRVPPLAAKAADYVDAYTYHDRMEGLPIGDEQGTRDRPYDLRVSFKHQAIDEALRGLGRQPWTAERPRVTVFLAVRNHGREYVLTSDGEHGLDQRDSLADAAWGAGLPMTLPSSAAIASAHLDAAELRSGSLGDAAGQARATGGQATLQGSIAWDDGFVGWHADWRLFWNGAAHQWAIRDVSFDEAFRNAMRGAAQILSGHGDPPAVAVSPKQG